MNFNITNNLIPLNRPYHAKVSNKPLSFFPFSLLVKGEKQEEEEKPYSYKLFNLDNDHLNIDSFFFFFEDFLCKWYFWPSIFYAFFFLISIEVIEWKTSTLTLKWYIWYPHFSPLIFLPFQYFKVPFWSLCKDYFKLVFKVAISKSS